MFLLALAVLTGAVFIVLPVWLSAKLFKAKRRGFLTCFFAALLSSFAFHAVSYQLGLLPGFLLGVAAMALVYQLLLGMGFWGGVGVAFAVAFLQALIYGVVLALPALLLGEPTPRQAEEGLIRMGAPAQVWRM